MSKSKCCIVILCAVFAFQIEAFALCIPAPDGLVSWWRAESDAIDAFGTNHGTLIDNATFTSGHVGQGFFFDGTTDAVQVGNPPELRLQNFTIECWVQRTSASVVSADFDQNDAGLVSYGSGGYGLGLRNNGNLYLTKVGVDAVAAATGITDTSWHHVAVTKNGNTVVFYADGVAYPVGSYNPTFTFGTILAIGNSGNGNYSFLGLMDEVAIYNRALSALEIQAIYAASSEGKCVAPSGPGIFVQPTNQIHFVGESTLFNAIAIGQQPYSYQWRYNNTEITGATNSALVFVNLQLTNAGDYTVVVSNLFGATTSAVAVLTVQSLPPCVLPPPGLLSWWTGDGHITDVVDGNSGVLAGNATYGPGKVGQALVFDGNRDGAQIGFATNLQLQDFSIEGWIKRTSSSVISFNGNGGGMIFAMGGSGGYGFFLQPDSVLALGRLQGATAISTASIADTNWHHVAVTKLNTNVVFYVDGVAFTVPSFDSGGFTFSASGYIGAWFNPSAQVDNSFYGTIDELSVYNHALTETEIQSIYNANLSGKCAPLVPPAIVTHPRNTNAVVGTNVTFTVLAGGSVPFTYQWRLNGVNLAGATNSFLMLSNIQFGMVGNYSVAITNAAGFALSSNAALTVTFPTAVVRAGSTSAMGGASVVVPVSLVANGNENAIGFSLNYNTQRLAFASAALGNGAAGGTLFLNTSMTATGRIGVAVSLPFQTNFAPGTQQVVRVTFNAFPLLGSQSSNVTISFADQPVLRELSDAQLQPLSAYYSNGIVSLAPTIFESDVSPRTNGNQGLSFTDWLQAGRFVARLDLTTSTNEFQRADCAPRSSFGDGQLKVTDWVQAGRYFTGLDTLAAVSGPIVESAPTFAGTSVNRHLQIASTNVIQSQSAEVSVNLDSQGNENALGFTITFDPIAFAFSSVELGSGAPGASLIPNTNQVASGKVGVAVALASGSGFSAGLREIVKLNLIASSSIGIFPVTLTDQVVTRCVSDIQAGELPVSYLNGNISVISANPSPVLSISRSNGNVVVSWPATAGDFTLQMVDTIGGLPLWSNAPGPFQTNVGEIRYTLPNTNQIRFFRLRR